MPKRYEELESKIIRRGICTLCGGCVAACPPNFLEIIQGRPKRRFKRAACKDCEICYAVCPQTKIEIAEKKGISEGEIGVYKRIISARTKDERLKNYCQDGGIVTTILKHALEENIIDAAVVVGRGENLVPQPIIATSDEDLIKAAGTKYGQTPSIIQLREAAEKGFKKVCIVGNSCHIQAIRRIQSLNIAPLSSAVAFVIGLFSRENYEYRCINERMEKLGIRISDIKKFSLSEEAFIVHLEEGGEEEVALELELKLELEEAKTCVPKACLLCKDYSSELADVSVGSDGSPEGWSSVIVRTEKGEEIFSGVEKKGLIEVSNADLSYICRISERKYKKARETEEIYTLRREGLSEEEIAQKLCISKERVLHRLEKF